MFSHIRDLKSEGLNVSLHVEGGQARRKIVRKSLESRNIRGTKCFLTVSIEQNHNNETTIKFHNAN